MNLSDNKSRCAWVGTNELAMDYHDHEWGVPPHDDRKLFEFLILEGAQAGLSWLTILKRREGYRQAFAGFDPAMVAAFDERDQSRLLSDEGIIRNRLKVQAAIVNAQQFLRIVKEFGSFDEYQWRFVDGKPVQNSWRLMAELPVATPQAESFSKDLKKRGFKFVGPTIIYAHMQATGMVNDHTTDCFRYEEIKGLR